MRSAEGQTKFTVPMRVLHWLMAVLILAQLFIGAAMIPSLTQYHRLLAFHRPLGAAILCLAAVRLIYRQFTTAPPWPPTMSATERRLAGWTERGLYFLMFAIPLAGWGALSAGHLPIVLYGRLHLPPILPARPHLYGVMRWTHVILAWLLFLTVLAHMSAVLYHTLVLRDRFLRRMTV